MAARGIEVEANAAEQPVAGMAAIGERPERIGARDVRPDIVDAQRQAIAAIFDAEPPIGIGAAEAQPLRADRIGDRSRRMAEAGDCGQRRAGRPALALA
ncbi:hypothetical protein MOP88_10965 [Sphingomonas sp. WKB10]|nr:hypothetical protein [Sphingomonas sp. WKB10]